MRGKRVGPSLAVLIAAGLMLTGCQGDPLVVDGVLWRQVVFQYKDPFFAALRDSLGSERDAVVANARWADGTFGGLRWDDGDPPPRSLASGGLVIWNVEDVSESVTFSVLIASGPRDADGDPLASEDERSAPYWGPDAVYTCFGIEAEFPERLFDSYGVDDDIRCPDELTRALDGADDVPLAAFAG